MRKIFISLTLFFILQCGVLAEDSAMSRVMNSWQGVHVDTVIKKKILQVINYYIGIMTKILNIYKPLLILELYNSITVQEYLKLMNIIL